jgi:hypothetical protein
MLTAPRQAAKDPVENRSLILCVFLPFVFGYYIAYLFRTINAVMVAPLANWGSVPTILACSRRSTS